MLLMIAQTLVAPVPTAPPAPPQVPRFAPTRIGDVSAPERRLPLDVVVRSAEGVLWSGGLIVGSRGQSSWTQSRSEPADPACAVRGVYASGERDGLNVQLYLVGTSDDPAARVAVTVRWSRRAEVACGGSRTVELSQIVGLADRSAVQIRGDGGLVIELRRR